MTELYRMTWAEVRERMKTAPKGMLYGVPRGGAIVAGMSGRATGVVGLADAIVDDIVDSGATRKRWLKENPRRPFWALVDKRGRDRKLAGKWVVFPWEQPDPLKDNTDIVRRLLELLGEDPTREGLVDTPARYLRAMAELTEGYKIAPKTILSTVFRDSIDEMIVVRHIPFWSVCEHHLLPFKGTATVAYVPKGRVIGLSKIPRLVHAFARRLQIQERLTRQIADELGAALKPRGTAVLVQAEHTCMAMRGIRSTGELVTSHLTGIFKRDIKAREEFLQLAEVRS